MNPTPDEMRHAVSDEKKGTNRLLFAILLTLKSIDHQLGESLHRTKDHAPTARRKRVSSGR